MYSFFGKYQKQQAGFSLIEMIVVIGISVAMFMVLFGGFKISLALIAQTRVKMTAMSLAQDRIEYIRSLSYNSVGTVSGIPNGSIPQNRTVTLNGIDFNERVLIEYVDDPADGQDTADTNGIPSDYKRVKVEYTWVVDGETRRISSISNIVPRSVETTAGGGSIRINVIGAHSQLLPGATVRLINEDLSIDVTRYTDVTGSALFSGAPAGSNYEVIVTGPIAGQEYSIDQTYRATTTNPTPVSAPFSVLESDVSTLTFRIGALSDLMVRMFSSVTETVVSETFTDALGVASSTASITVVGGEARLTDIAGVYDNNGFLYLNPVTPTTNEQWGYIKIGADLPANTEYRVFVYQPTAPYSLVSDSDLPGNSTGFTSGLIDLSTLDAATYSSLVVGIALSTSDTAVTPRIEDVFVVYREDSTPIVGEDFNLTGLKLIGANVYKNDISATTDSSGERLFADLEFDLYEVITSNSYTIAEACGGHPFAHEAGVDGELDLTLVSPLTHSLRVVVKNAVGEAVPGADITLTRPGYNQTHPSSLCGQYLFTGISSANSDFELTVEAPGFITNNVTGVSVDGETVYEVVLLQ